MLDLLSNSLDTLKQNNTINHVWSVLFALLLFLCGASCGLCYPVNEFELFFLFFLSFFFFFSFFYGLSYFTVRLLLCIAYQFPNYRITCFGCINKTNNAVSASIILKRMCRMFALCETDTTCDCNDQRLKPS